MKETFRQSMAWLHTWAGLVSGWVLFFIFVMGTGTYFKDEITRWMEPERPLRAFAAYPSGAEMAELALDHLARQPGSSNTWVIHLPNDGSRAGNNDSRGDSRGLTVASDVLGTVELDPRSGAEIRPTQVRATEGGDVFRNLHYQLHYMDAQTGEYIVGVCTMLMLLACITGVIVHKKIFKDFFTFRPGKGQRSWLDAHNVVSVMALPFFLMISYSGLMILGNTLMPVPVKAVYGPERSDFLRFNAQLLQRKEQLPVSRPAVPMAQVLEQAERILGPGEAREIVVSHAHGEPLSIKVSRTWGTELPIVHVPATTLLFDANSGARLAFDGDGPALRAHRWMAALHFGWFANAGVRWLYFACGLLGCAMIATGLVLWTVKRRARHDGAVLGLRLVEVLNTGTLAGLPVGVAAYFWANRLLPVTMADRADWELHLLFLTWGWLLLYAALRPVKAAWLETLWLAAAAFGLIPLLNWLTTDKHLGATIPHGDWVLAGFDLTMLGLGAVFAWTAVKLRRKWAVTAAPAVRGKTPASATVAEALQ
jgi:uncharacterized iron-regulated membrane protein